MQANNAKETKCNRAQEASAAAVPVQTLARGGGGVVGGGGSSSGNGCLPTCKQRALHRYPQRLTNCECVL